MGWTDISIGRVGRRGINGSKDTYMFKRKCSTFSKWLYHLHFHWPCMRSPIFEIFSIMSLCCQLSLTPPFSVRSQHLYKWLPRPSARASAPALPLSLLRTRNTQASASALACPSVWNKLPLTVITAWSFVFTQILLVSN